MAGEATLFASDLFSFDQVSFDQASFDQEHGWPAAALDKKQVPRLRRTIRFTNRPTSLGIATVLGLLLRRTLPNR